MLSGPAAMELKVWVDGIQRVVCGVSEQTTCQEVVIALAQAIGESPPGHTDPTRGPGVGGLALWPCLPPWRVGPVADPSCPPQFLSPMGWVGPVPPIP